MEKGRIRTSRLRRANIASIVGSEDACEGLAAALAGVEGVAVAEELLPYVVRAVVLQPYASAKLVRLHNPLSPQMRDSTKCKGTKQCGGPRSSDADTWVLRMCEQNKSLPAYVQSSVLPAGHHTCADRSQGWLDKVSLHDD